ncbi:hypothetical protein TIFTF001_023728 [Ficus carica]|uniref:DUF1985 domain-containing protein n=1 Tax=Ficus carica TaxID=3494 RepID=A0AA88DK85_FICCA|nr:hypothetical protein TIFTF001_023728 [Ficus carica]
MLSIIYGVSDLFLFSSGFLLLRRATVRLLNANLSLFFPISNFPHTPYSQHLKLRMSESDVPSSPPLIMSSASSSQATTSLLSSSPPGFGRNDREETNEMNINSSNEEVDEEEPDMSRMVLTSEIKELPPLILAEYFSAKVTIRSKMAILEEIQIWLTEEEKTVFRSYPQLGHFIDLPIGGAFSGLYTGGGPSEDEIKAQEQNDELKNKYWPTKKGVSLADVAQKLKELSVTKVRTDDRVKLAFLYMVAGFLMSSDSKKVVNPSWLQYANDLNFFTQYPWGNVCYNQTLDYIKTDLVAKFNKSSTTYNFYGCPWIFQIWAFEAMPKLGEMLANKLALNEKNKNGSRCLRWQIVKNPIGTSFERCLEAMRYPEFTVRPTLNSTSKERQRDYYLRMEIREDCSDDVIDGLTKLLEGDVILCSVADCDQRYNELRSSHITRDPAMHSRSFPVSSAHEQMIRSSTPVVYHRQHPMPTSPTFLDPATASTSFPTIPTMFEPIRTSPPRDEQTHGPTPTFSTHFGPQTDDVMPTASTPTLESLMHYIDRRIGEHETHIKSMLANHEAAMMQKMEEINKAMEENNKTIMEKIEAAMAMHKEPRSGGVNVEFEQVFSPGVGTRYSGGDNFHCQQHLLQDEQIREGAEYTHDRVVNMQVDANIENVQKSASRPERLRKRAAVLRSPYVVQLPNKMQHSSYDAEKRLQAASKPTKTL